MAIPIVLMTVLGPIIRALGIVVLRRRAAWRPLLLSGLIVGATGLIAILIGAIMRTMSVPHSAIYELGWLLVLGGWFWLPEGVATLVAGGVMRLVSGIPSRTSKDSQ